MWFLTSAPDLYFVIFLGNFLGKVRNLERILKIISEMLNGPDLVCEGEN